MSVYVCVLAAKNCRKTRKPAINAESGRRFAINRLLRIQVLEKYGETQITESSTAPRETRKEKSPRVQ